MNIKSLQEYKNSKNMKKIAQVLGLVVMLGCVIAGALIMYERSLPIIKPPQNIEDTASMTFDVIVIGTDPEGISAALSSARNGMTTLLIDSRERIGGLFTLAGLNSLDMNYYEARAGGTATLLTQGIFKEFLEDTGSRPTIINKKYSRDSFDVTEVEAVFNKMIAREDDITLQLGMDSVHPIVENNVVVGVTAVTNGQEYDIYGTVLIDATQDADIAAEAGVPFTIGLETLNLPDQMQAITPIFKVEGIEWDKMKSAIKANESLYDAYYNNYSIWGFAPQMKGYEPISVNTKVRGPNIGRQNDDSALLNMIQMVSYDPLDDDDIAKIFDQAEAEVRNLIEYMRHEIPGFENAEFAGVMEELYIRESRHIEGEYTLSIVDVMQNKNFEDKIAWGSYPVDVQTTNMDNTGYVLGDPAAYSIPFRCLVPKEIDNLLVVGRSASFDPLAFGSARVVPIGMATAEAAGVAAAYSINNDVTFREISYDHNMVGDIQKTLVKQGAYLEDLHIPYNYDGLKAEEAINFLYSFGFMSGGYENDLRLDDIATEVMFYNALNMMVVRTDATFPFTDYIYKNMSTPIPPRDIISVLWQMLDRDTMIDFDTKVEAMKKENILSEESIYELTHYDMITNETLYMVLYEFYLFNR
ncbi:MAG: hypothetical protein ATN35_06680 [Epulopiscium sp. Nele67-Bin004]|nr:MAG: hypothetical protein ATN35_06680 [Epulopiscium sp. Nele67-Bin004]